MKHPQDLAKELNELFPNEDLKKISDFACCAFVVMWCLGVDPEDIDAIKLVQEMRKKGVIRNDCVVFWYKIVPYLTGRELENIEFKKITSLKGIKGRTPVLMAKAGNAEGDGHWVGIENEKIKFNPKKYSVNVEKGKPVEARILKIKGVK
ncbi:MAG: hypothetical protein IKF66_01170 [Methanobrevibacter sp.]|nr:hypothetical protein [Methanobrevibacter sp.]